MLRAQQGHDIMVGIFVVFKDQPKGVPEVPVLVLDFLQHFSFDVMKYLQLRNLYTFGCPGSGKTGTLKTAKRLTRPLVAARGSLGCVMQQEVPATNARLGVVSTQFQKRIFSRTQATFCWRRQDRPLGSAPTPKTVLNGSVVEGRPPGGWKASLPGCGAAAVAAAAGC